MVHAFLVMCFTLKSIVIGRESCIHLTVLLKFKLSFLGIKSHFALIVMDMPRKYVYTYYYVVPAATFTLNKSRSTLLNKRGNVIYLCRTRD